MREWGEEHLDCLSGFKKWRRISDGADDCNPFIPCKVIAFLKRRAFQSFFFSFPLSMYLFIYLPIYLFI